MSAVGSRAVGHGRLVAADARLIAGGLVVVATSIVLALRFAAAGSPMDEGGVLAYATRIVAGEVPGRNLHSFYGPLGTYLVAAVFKVFGASLAAERTVGLSYRVIAVVALVFIARRRGVWAIAGVGAMAMFVLPAEGLAAFATYGALAFAMVAIALAGERRALGAGLAAGGASLMRFDWALPLVLAAVPFLWWWPWRMRLRLVGGAMLGAWVYVPYLAVVGPARLQLWVEELRSGQASRRLPFPALTSHSGHILELTLLAIVLLAIAGLRVRETGEGMALLATALLGVGLFPYALLRADRPHVLIAATAPIALLPTAVAVLGAGYRLAGITRTISAIAGCGVLALVLLASVRASLDAASAYSVTYDGRSFRVSDPLVARDAQRAVDRASSLAPANGSLFVGPSDLRNTSYSDAYMYFLLPHLRPGTFYITLDPGSTNARGVRLADELRATSVLILNAAYDRTSDANAIAEKYGPAAPNRIVAHQFCARGAYGSFRVYARC